MAGENDRGIEAKLDILIRLQALGLVKDLGSMKEKILFLSDAGFQPKAISDLLQTSSNHVNVTLSTARRGKRKAKE